MPQTPYEFQYPCHGMHDALTKGRASGQVTLSKMGLAFDIKGKQIHVSLEGLEISQGGASDRLIFFKHPAHSEWRFYTSDRTILKNPILMQHPRLGAALKKARNKHRFNWGLLAGTLAALVLIPILLLTNLDVASKIIARQVPVEWEENLASASFDQYSLQSELMDEKAGKQVLTPIVSPLIQALPDKRYQYQFYITNDPQLNAFALPGGVVVINSGLILKASSAEELLGVVAHEISHVREQHGLRNIISSAGTYLILSAVVGDVSGLMGVLVDAAPLLINQGYSRKFESEADEKGFDILVQANIDPKGLASFFEKLVTEENKQLAEIEDEQQRELIKTGMGFLSSHPATQDRIDDLMAQAAVNEANYLNFDDDFKLLQDAVRQFVTDTNAENNADSHINNGNIESNSSANHIKVQSNLTLH